LLFLSISSSVELSSFVNGSGDASDRAHTSTTLPAASTPTTKAPRAAAAQAYLSPKNSISLEAEMNAAKLVTHFESRFWLGDKRV
jgi:hypothetical protein